MTKLYPEFYNDVFGPLMQHGSSSHMAAPCRIGCLCSSLRHLRRHERGSGHV